MCCSQIASSTYNLNFILFLPSFGNPRPPLCIPIYSFQLMDRDWVSTKFCIAVMFVAA